MLKRLLMTMQGKGGVPIGAPPPSPVTISTSSSPDATAYGHQRKIVRTTDAQNTLHVFFHDGNNIEWWRSADGGANWSQVASRTGKYPSVVRDSNNNLHLVYTSIDRLTLYYCVQAYNASAFGTQRTLPALISGYDVFGAPNINVAIINGTPYVFVIVNQYSTAGAKHSAVWTCFSNDGGVTWYKPDMVTVGWQSCSGDFVDRHLSNVPSCYLAVQNNLNLHAMYVYRDLGSSNTGQALATYVSTPFPHWEPTTWTLITPTGYFHDPNPNSWCKETNEWVWGVGKRYGYVHGDLEEWDYLGGWYYRGNIWGDNMRYPCVALELTQENDAWFFYESSTVNPNFDISYAVWDKSAGVWRKGVTRITNDNLGNHYINVKEREDNNRMEFIYTKGISAPYNVVFLYVAV